MGAEGHVEASDATQKKELEAISATIDAASRFEQACMEKISLKDVCVMAFLGPHDLSRRVFQSAAISEGGLALWVCVMRLPGFVCLR